MNSLLEVTKAATLPRTANHAYSNARERERGRRARASSSVLVLSVLCVHLGGYNVVTSSCFFYASNANAHMDSRYYSNPKALMRSHGGCLHTASAALHLNYNLLSNRKIQPHESEALFMCLGRMPESWNVLMWLKLHVCLSDPADLCGCQQAHLEGIVWAGSVW